MINGEIWKMHIEIIGSTSAGKTTLARKMAEEGAKNGTRVFLSDDFILEEMHLKWVGNDFMRRRLVEAGAFVVLLKKLSKYKAFINFVISEGKQSPGSWYYKINRIRNVLRKIGIFEFIAKNANAQKVIVLADNEGLLQGVHNLFVHQGFHANLEKISRYVEFAGLPDVVLYLKQEENVLISRTLSRGHERVESEYDEVANFIKQAVKVFNELVGVPSVQRRLLVVNGLLDVEYNGVELGTDTLHQVVSLLQK